MKKVIGLMMLSLLLITSCMTYNVMAPTHSNIQLLSATEPAAFKITKRAMYTAFGLVPLGNNSTDDVITKYDLENVRVTVQYGIVDYIVSYIFGPIFSTHQIIIEGNAKK
jgi:hypothetical protein